MKVIAGVPVRGTGAKSVRRDLMLAIRSACVGWLTPRSRAASDRALSVLN